MLPLSFQATIRSLRGNDIMEIKSIARKDAISFSLYAYSLFVRLSFYTFLVLMQPRVCARKHSGRQADKTNKYTHRTKPLEASQETEQPCIPNQPPSPPHHHHHHRLLDLVKAQPLTRYLTSLVITPRNHHPHLSLTCPMAALIHAQVSCISAASTRSTWNPAHLWYECVRGTSRQKGAVFMRGLQFDVLGD